MNNCKRCNNLKEVKPHYKPCINCGEPSPWVYEDQPMCYDCIAEQEDTDLSNVVIMGSD